MGREIIVGMGEYFISHNEDILVCLGLGSCVGIAIYDEEKHIGGFANITLPDSEKAENNRKDTNATKYADISIPMMIKEMEMEGCSREHMKAKIVGGTNSFGNLSSESDIGKMNVDVSLSILKEHRIDIIAIDTEGDYGRTANFDLSNFKIIIKGKNEIKEI